MKTVRNILTKNEYHFLDTTPILDALVSAYAHEMKDGNTWDWEKYYPKIESGIWHFFLSDLCIRKGTSEIKN